MSRKNEPFDLGPVEILKKTERSFLVKSADYGEVWIPFSQLHEDSRLDADADEGDSDEMTVTQWLAEERSWA